MLQLEFCTVTATSQHTLCYYRDSGTKMVDAVVYVATPTTAFVKTRLAVNMQPA